MKKSITLAIVPARAGSKRIIGKNTREFSGKPMIHWPLKVLTQSGLFDHIVVSTDDEQISSVARDAGGETPFLRPKALSDDHTPLRPVIKHAIQASENYYNKPVDHVCCVLATAAFLQVDDLQKGKNNLESKNVKFSFCATFFPAPPQRGLKYNVNGGVEMLKPEYRFTRSQDLEEYFYDVGQFYWGKRDSFLDDAYMYGEHSVPVIIEQNRARDIDTEEDWKEAEFLMEYLNRKQKEIEPFLTNSRL